MEPDELAGDAEQASGLLALAIRGEPLADFECEHGSLPSDEGLLCQCWSPGA